MTDWSRIAKLAGMLGSAGDGEVVNAARLIDRALKAQGLSWGDFANRLNGGVSAARTSAERAQSARRYSDDGFDDAAWEERMRQEEEKARQRSARRNRGDW